MYSSYLLSRPSLTTAFVGRCLVVVGDLLRWLRRRSLDSGDGTLLLARIIGVDGLEVPSADAWLCAAVGLRDGTRAEVGDPLVDK